jgi:uncharacterized integral membrane protein
MTSDPYISPDQPIGEMPPGPIEPIPPIAPERTVLPETAVKFTRAAALWSALIVGFLILILLLVFIMQNTDSTTIHLFAWQWNLPVGVAILLAAVCGGLLTVAAATARIIQLRRAAKKNLKAMPTA